MTLFEMEKIKIREHPTRVAILGAGRGLGAELTRLAKDAASAVLGMSKQASRLESAEHFQTVDLDFTKPDAALRAHETLMAFSPTHVWYVAGGGPFGRFGEKKWRDHQWALQLNFLFPMELFHSSLKDIGWRQWVWVGSAIAEKNPEVNGLAYGASKRALLAAWACWQAEQLHNPAWGADHKRDVRLYSPGYMDTSLLPPNAWPRKAGSRIESVATVARDFLRWSFDEVESNTHRQFGLGD